MPKTISFTALADELKRDLTRQAAIGLPRAAATALSRTALSAREAVKRDMTRIFDRPTPYALNGLRAAPATQATLTSKVALKEFGGTPAVNFLGPEILGGPRHVKRFEKALRYKGILPDDMYAEPSKQARLDQFGNLYPGEIVQILSALGAFQEVGYMANRTAKSAARRAKAKRAKPLVKYFVAKDKNTKRPLGIYKVVSRGVVRPVIIFSRRPSYNEKFDLQSLVGKYAKEVFESQLFRALAEGKTGGVP